MSPPLPLVTICVCTFRRPAMLRRLLSRLLTLHTAGLFEFSIVVVDNDAQRSAQAVVAEAQNETTVRVTYEMEPEQNISLARNRALRSSTGDFVALLDDDECPSSEWLVLMFQALQKYSVDGVLGPVEPVFESPPPAWIQRGRFFHKPRRTTGLRLNWRQTSTANVFFARRILEGISDPFRREFGSGCEDLDFFHRMMKSGRTFVWCDEALVSEIIPPTRWTSRYLVRRALLRGRNGLALASPVNVAKAFLAIPLYTLALPLLLVAGRHLFVRYLMKLGDHVGLLGAMFRVRFMGDKYLAG